MELKNKECLDQMKSIFLGNLKTLAVSMALNHFNGFEGEVRAQCPRSSYFASAKTQNLALLPAVTGLFHPNLLYILHLRPKSLLGRMEFDLVIEQIAGSWASPPLIHFLAPYFHGGLDL